MPEAAGHLWTQNPGRWARNKSTLKPFHVEGTYGFNHHAGKLCSAPPRHSRKQGAVTKQQHLRHCLTSERPEPSGQRDSQTTRQDLRLRNPRRRECRCNLLLLPLHPFTICLKTSGKASQYQQQRVAHRRPLSPLPSMLLAPTPAQSCWDSASQYWTLSPPPHPESETQPRQPVLEPAALQPVSCRRQVPSVQCLH